MTRIPVHTVHSAPEASRDTLTSLEARFGKVLNIHGAMAHSPVVLDAYAALQHSIAEHGTFDGKTREAIALLVAAVDRCSYCQAAHTAGGKAAGLSEQDTIDARRGTSNDPGLQALLTVVGEQMSDLDNVSDASWQGALDAGWTAAQLAESTLIVALNIFTNFFNHTVQTELDLPAAPACEPPPMRWSQPGCREQTIPTSALLRHVVLVGVRTPASSCAVLTLSALRVSGTAR